MGHSEKPSDWETLYGTAPYTSGNIVMWEAIAAKSGRYGKLNATSYIPVDESGNLLDPIAAKVVKHFNVRNQNANWKFGDQAPAETAWRRSSAYPFTLMKLLALTKPAKFFGLFFDNSRITKNISNNIIDRDTDIRQTFSTAKYHLESISSVRQITSGYQPWIVNYLISKNLNPATFFIIPEFSIMVVISVLNSRLKKVQPAFINGSLILKPSFTLQLSSSSFIAFSTKDNSSSYFLVLSWNNGFIQSLPRVFSLNHFPIFQSYL